nr:MAG TPA: hypothetical protein [Caudoviricetes sp.]
MPSKRNFALKRRGTAHIPAEKLLSILRGIYPEELAQEVFKTLQGKNDGSRQRDAAD